MIDGPQVLPEALDVAYRKLAEGCTLVVIFPDPEPNVGPRVVWINRKMRRLHPALYSSVPRIRGAWITGLARTMHAFAFEREDARGSGS